AAFFRYPRARGCMRVADRRQTWRTAALAALLALAGACGASSAKSDGAAGTGGGGGTGGTGIDAGPCDPRTAYTEASHLIVNVSWPAGTGSVRGDGQLDARGQVR